MKKICFVTNKYPNILEKNALVFLQQLVWEISDSGIKCEVICPVPINLSLKYLQFPKKIVEETENGSLIDVYFPKYISFGQSYIGKYNPANITTDNFTRAVNNVINKMIDKPDAVYGHFVTPAGIAAARIGRKYNIPSFMAYGEATLNTVEHFGEANVRDELKTLSGVVSVSTHNKDVLVSKRLVNKEKIGIFPNGFRKERFYQRNKKKARKIFDLPDDAFIISFVGSFDNRKGINRVLQAVEKVENAYLIIAGKGNIDISNNNKVLYCDSVNNNKLPYFLSASDVFLLPTLAEGCSNAIVEAIACGLPIISSDLPFNDDILDKNNSIRINPLDISEIKSAIIELRNDSEKRESMSESSVKKSKELTLNKRAKDIIKFMDTQITSYMNEK